MLSGSIFPSWVVVVGTLLSLCIGSPGIGSVHMNSVLPDHLGRYNFEELETSIYSVVVAAAPVAEETLDNFDDSLGETDSTTKSEDLMMVSNRGQKFVCVVPVLQVGESSSAKDEEEHIERFPNVSKMLSPLAERACLIKTVGWWTYEYCHGKFVRQYHLEAGSPVGETFYLGYYKNETVWTEEQIKVVSDSRKMLRSGEVNPRAFHSVHYDNGTGCDVSKKPRTAQVKIMCVVSGLDRLAGIQEVDTCSYLLHVHSSLLCGVPYFKREQLEDAQVIKCSPLVSKEKYEAYLEQKRQSEVEAKDRADMDRIRSKDMSASVKSAPPKLEEDANVKIVGDVDERTLLFYRLLTSMVSDITDREKDEQLEVLRKKFKDLSNEHLEQVVKRLEQEQGKEEEQKGESGGNERQGVFEKAESKELEGVVKAEGGEEEEVLVNLEMDDESLSTLEQAVTNEVKEKLSELGLPTDGVEVKLKVTTLELDDQTKAELESDQEITDSGMDEQTASKEEKKKSEVKVIRLTLLTDSFGSQESQTRKRETEANEKVKMSYLEQAYNFVWDNKQEEGQSRRRKQSQ